jgi:hypothetical protein
VFTLELLDSFGVMDALVIAQVVFVGKFPSACRTGIGALLNREVYGEMDVEDGLADGGIGAKVTRVGAGSAGRHGLEAEATSGWVTEFVDLVEMSSEGDAIDEAFDAQGTLVDVGEMHLYVEELLKGVVGPIDTVGTGVTATGSERLGLVHALDRKDEGCEG